MIFHPIKISDRPLFLKYFQNDRTTCDRMAHIPIARLSLCFSKRLKSMDIH